MGRVRRALCDECESARNSSFGTFSKPRPCLGDYTAPTAPCFGWLSNVENISSSPTKDIPTSAPEKVAGARGLLAEPARTGLDECLYGRGPDRIWCFCILLSCKPALVTGGRRLCAYARSVVWGDRTNSGGSFDRRDPVQARVGGGGTLHDRDCSLDTRAASDVRLRVDSRSPSRPYRRHSRTCYRGDKSWPGRQARDVVARGAKSSIRRGGQRADRRRHGTSGKVFGVEGDFRDGGSPHASGLDRAWPNSRRRDRL